MKRGAIQKVCTITTGKQGAILIITLWILAILAILSIGIGGRMGLELKLTGFYRDNTAALYLAKAGIKRSIAVLQSEEHAVDSLNEKWSCNTEETDPLFKDIKVGDAGTFTVNYPFYDKRVFYGVQDEERRININNAPKEVISGLISYLDPANANAGEIAANIEDWRDADATRPDGTPEYSYSAEGYGRKDALFDSADEVLLVRGVDQGLFEKIKGYITVYPIAASAKVNVNTASLPALVALGFSEDDANAIIVRRAGEDGVEGTADDAPFDSNSFAVYLTKLAAPSAAVVSYGSQYFRVISTGYSSNGRARKTVTCVASSVGEILFWNEE